MSSVVVVEIVEFVHLKVEILQRNLQLANLLLVSQVVVVQPELLLFEDRFLCLKIIAITLHSRMLILLLNKISLISDPLLLDLGDAHIGVLDLFEDVVPLGLEWARAFVIALLIQISVFPIEPVNSELLLFDLDVSALYFIFKAFDFLFFFFKFVN